MQSADDHFLRDLNHFPPEARKLVREALPDAANQLPPEQLARWLEGARRLLETGVGLVPLASYLRTVPAVAKQGGEAVLIHTIATALSVATHAGARAADAFLRALPLIVRRLITGDAMLGFLDAADEITALAPRALADLFQRAGPLLEQVSVDGLRRWALLGVQGHLTDPGAQGAWFRLESQDARAILRAASEGTAFTDVERRLGFYLRALWGRSMALRAGSAPAAAHRGERKTGRRVSIVEGAIRMPPAFDAFPGQQGITLYRAACAHAAAHLVYSTQRLQLRQLSPVQVVLVSLIEDARAEQLALHALPGLRKLWLPFHVALPSSTVSSVSLMARLARALIDPGYRDDNPWVIKGRTLFAEHADSLEGPALSTAIGMLLGNELEEMRVRFDYKTYLVEPLYRDDNRFLWDFGDAGQQQSDDEDVMHQVVDLRAVEGAEPAPIEVEQRGSRSAQQQDAQTGLVSGEEQQLTAQPLTRPYQYDEWDYAIGMNRASWCTLLEKRPRLGEAHEIDEVLMRNQQTVDRLASLIKAAQIQRPLRLRKQLEGDKLDLDAAITATVDLRSGRTPDPRVHQRQGKTSRDLAVLLLLDLSQSTNDYVPSAGTTVLNLAREATALVADAMDKIGDSFAIHGFDSNGRHEVEYYRFKDFDEPYGELSRARLAGMTGQLSTRMGAALRHAGHFLRFRRAARKLVLLVTDGEPHDIDVHDRKYLVFDAKHAVEEQTRFGIATFCISLDAGADEYVTRIFGARNYLVLDHLRRLPEKLPLLYMRLTT
jgi:nitric oxide reductase NorD protein